MDASQLRNSSKKFNKKLEKGESLTTFEFIGELMDLEEELFIWELYKQLLLREPDEGGFQSHLTQLQGGCPRLVLMDAILQSQEAAALYDKPSQQFSDIFPLARLLQRLVHGDHGAFIRALYQEFLNRQPDDQELQSYIQQLEAGTARTAIRSGFLLSEEFQELLSKNRPFLMENSSYSRAMKHVSNGSMKHIGVFLGYHHPVTLSGEGIGSFISRLVEGWLHNRSDVMVHIAITQQNKEQAEKLLSKQLSTYSNRLWIHSFPNMSWLNRHLDVDVWCVPYVGLKWALELSKPYVLCVHDLVYLHFKKLYADQQPEFLTHLQPIVDAMAGKAAKVVFNSNYIRDHEGLQFLKLPLHQTRVIRLAPPLEEYRLFGLRFESTFRRKYNLHSPYLVFPSVMRLHKNHDRLIEAFLNFKKTSEGKTSGLRLVLTDDYRNRPFEKRIRELLERCHSQEERNSVVFLGRLSSADLPSLYKYAVGTIVPTLFEGSCPFPILESLTVDTPVAISRIDVATEVITDMSAFISFDPYSVKEIEAAIRKLWRTHEGLAPLQKAAIRGVLRRTWSDAAREYDSLFDEVLSKKQ
ncbi:DUF4214 domain-containing protein [Paenibacillus sp. FSL H8-0034]|uniref:DUF4214 domain-containing protein n=1 Tax=Paenibacillus sp. FSL H8-0034 TaxID=2954671 RepID=UPI0030FB6F86